MKIICIENNFDKKQVNPILSLMPETSILRKNHPFFIPEFTNDIRCEIGLMIKLCKNGRHISERFADTYFNEIAVAVNFTAYDVLMDCRRNKKPWDIAIGFDFSVAIGSFIHKEKWINPFQVIFQLKINEKIILEGNAEEMNFAVQKMISYSSQFFFLKMGDFIFSGGKKSNYVLQIGDHAQAYLNGTKMIDFMIK